MSILTAVGEELHSNKPLTVGYDLATTYDEQLVVLHGRQPCVCSRRYSGRSYINF